MLLERLRYRFGFLVLGGTSYLAYLGVRVFAWAARLDAESVGRAYAAGILAGLDKGGKQWPSKG